MPTSLITPRFVTIGTSALFYFVAIAMLLPTLPRYVEEELGGSSTQVGVVIGAFGVSAAVIRPLLGRLGDRYGRRVLLVGGAFLSGAMALLYPVWLSIPILIGLRILTGIGEAGAFVGAATSIQDLAPDDRRGEAASYFSLAIYVGLGVGPFLGEYLAEAYGFDAVVRVSFALSMMSSVLAFAIPSTPPVAAIDRRDVRPMSFLHRAAILPGVLLTLSLVGFVGYTSFLALYLDDITGGTASAGLVFLVYAAIVVVFRLAFATLPDKLGARRGSMLAFTFIAVGLSIVAVWSSLVGVYVGTVVLAIGIAFNYPALFLFVMSDTQPHERSHSVASFGFFFDIAGALGAPLLGVIIDATDSEQAAFGAGALAALIGLIGIRLMSDGETMRVQHV